MFGADGDAGLQPGVDAALAGHIGDVEQVVVLLLGGKIGLFRGDLDGAHRIGVGPGCGDGYQLFFRIAERGQGAAEDAAGVQVDGVVQPLGPGHGGVAVRDDGFTPVVGGPVVADGQAELVGLAGGLAVQGELTHGAGGAASQVGAHAGVGDDQAALVEHEVAHQLVDEAHDFAAKFGGAFGYLVEGSGKAVGALHLAALQGAQQAGVVVAGHAQGGACFHHIHDPFQDSRDIGAAVGQVAEEHGFAAGRRGDLGSVDCVAQFFEQGSQFGGTAVHVADDIEGAGFVAAVGPQFVAVDAEAGDFFC